MSWKEFKKEPDDGPLAGDELEMLLEKIGADKLAELYEEVSGNDCGCDKRKEWLNNLHRRIRDWWNNKFK